MRLVDHHEVVAAPVHLCEVESVRLSAFALDVRVAQDVVAQLLGGERVVAVHRLVVHVPVRLQLLRAEDEDVLVAEFVVADHGESRERLTKADGIREDAAGILLQLVYDGDCRVVLEVKELLPHERILVADGGVRHRVLVKVLQRLLEEVFEDEEVHKLRLVVAIDGGNVFRKLLGHVPKPAASPHLAEARPERRGVSAA